MGRKHEYLILIKRNIGQDGLPQSSHLQKIAIESGLPVLIEDEVAYLISISKSHSRNMTKNEGALLWKIVGDSDVEALKQGKNYAEILFQVEVFLSGLDLLEKELDRQRISLHEALLFFRKPSNVWRFISYSKYLIGVIESKFDSLTHNLDEYAPKEVSDIVKRFKNTIKIANFKLERKRGDIEAQNYIIRSVLFILGILVGLLIDLLKEILTFLVSPFL